MWRPQVLFTVIDLDDNFSLHITSTDDWVPIVDLKNRVIPKLELGNAYSTERHSIYPNEIAKFFLICRLNKSFNNDCKSFNKVTIYD